MADLDYSINCFYGAKMKEIKIHAGSGIFPFCNTHKGKQSFPIITNKKSDVTCRLCLNKIERLKERLKK